MARQRIECVTLLVQDYDEAISYFSEKLGFQVVENRDLGGGKRWGAGRASGAARNPTAARKSRVSKSNVSRWRSDRFAAVHESECGPIPTTSAVR